YQLLRVSIDNRHTLNLNDNPRPRETRYRNQGARRIFAIRKRLTPHLSKSRPQTRVEDKHRHGHHISERAAGPTQCVVEIPEYLEHLRFKIVRDVSPLAVLRRGMTGKPHGAPALGDHRR